MAKSAFKEYREKRNFETTPEPEDGKDLELDTESPIFVIQKHHFTRDQYFLRLESHGVLKSWRIPDGITMNPNEEQFARQEENHPLGYADFEGKIPEDSLNKGKVMICDRGNYENIKVSTRKTIQKDIKEGKVQIWLNGERVQGGFELKKFELGEEKWLFKKLKDKHADPKDSLEQEFKSSLVSEKKIAEI